VGHPGKRCGMLNKLRRSAGGDVGHPGAELLERGQRRRVGRGVEVEGRNEVTGMWRLGVDLVSS
jgi:hypothetical protein